MNREQQDKTSESTKSESRSRELFSIWARKILPRWQLGRTQVYWVHRAEYSNAESVGFKMY
jgi:hypothetical protein